MLIRNNNDRFGDEGPYEAENFEALADEMTDNFEAWSRESEIGKTVEDIRAEFLAGLEEVE